MAWLLKNIVLIEAILKNEIFHFFISGFLGFAGFWLTSTIYTVCLKSWPKTIYGNSWVLFVARFIRFTPFAVGLLLALFSHYFLDAAVDWYTMPLGPPLDLGGYN